MSGILDSKSRIIDAILTVEGRRQMAAGTFEISYATFSDYGVSYLPDSENGHEDPAGKIYFEACNLPQDQITFEANDEGRLNGIRFSRPLVQGSSITSSLVPSTLFDGRLTSYNYHQGRFIKASAIAENSNDDYKGFIYSDKTGLTASVLVRSDLPARTVSVSTPSPPGSPFIGYVGTRGGMGPEEFITSISGTISRIRTIGGPNVFFTTYNDTLYLDTGDSFLGSRIFATGSLSSPLTLEESAIGGKLLTGEIEGPYFASQITGILTSSFDNFLELQSIATIDRFFEDDKFELTVNELNFDLSKSNNSVLNAFRGSPPTLNSIDSLFSDNKFSNLENYMYLPPIVKTPDSIVPDKTKIENLTPYLLGETLYPSWGDNQSKLNYSSLMSEVQKYGDIKDSIYFDKTSNKNNVIAQVFQITDSTVSKLDVVEFGEMKSDSGDGDFVTNKVFFAGKTFFDNRGTTCFVNLFTFVFSKDSRATQR